MSEVKRLKDHIEQFENHNPGETARVKGDDDKIYYHADFAVLLSDKIAKKEIQLQSERAARIAAETKLAELEDLFYFQEIIDKGNHDSDNLEEGFESEFYDNLDNQISQKLETIRAQAIANSKARSKS